MDLPWFEHYRNAGVFSERITKSFWGRRLRIWSQNIKTQDGDLAHNISLNSDFFCCNWLENSYLSVSRIANDDFEVRLWKCKMVNLIWRSPTQNSINCKFILVLYALVCCVLVVLVGVLNAIAQLNFSLPPEFWILSFWLQIRNQRPQKTPSKSFPTGLRTFRELL